MILYRAALIAGGSFYFADRIVGPGPTHVVWKGAGVALLAIWAARRARSVDGWLLAAVLAFGAAGDVILETHGTASGGALFLIGHLLAILLYARNLRPGAHPALVVFAAALVVAVLAWALPTDRTQAAGIAIYAAGLGAMLGMAWSSRFGRDWVALGAVLFVLSDLLIFARLGPLADSTLPRLLIWPTYFAGQALIAAGVMRGLERRR